MGLASTSYDEIRVRHQGDIVGEIIEATYNVFETSKKMIKSAEQMSLITGQTTNPAARGYSGQP